MPELPEVETTRRGIAPHVEGQRIRKALVREPRLRWPVSPQLNARVTGQTVRAVDRRGKYLIVGLERDSLIVHLGMSGALRALPRAPAPGPHDHWDLVLSNTSTLRYTDPRRFGSLHLTRHPRRHPLIARLGVEPLDPAFNGARLYAVSRGRRVAVKHLLMNARIVAGLGNIYVCEALWRAGIHPTRPAGRIGEARYERLTRAVRAVLTEAIGQGGTTLRDFVQVDGQPGRFRVALQIYGCDGQPCPRCARPIRRITQGQRGTWYCPGCQR